MNTKYKNKRYISRFIFHIIVAFITNLLLFGFALIVLIPTRIIQTNSLILLSGVIFVISLISASFAGYMSRWSNQLKVTLRKVGLGSGRLVGAFIGYFIGFVLGGIIWAIIGALAFYFLGRRLGPQLSLYIGSSLERIFEIQAPQEKIVSEMTPKKEKAYNCFFLIPSIIFCDFCRFFNAV